METLDLMECMYLKGEVANQGSGIRMNGRKIFFGAIWKNDEKKD